MIDLMLEYFFRVRLHSRRGPETFVHSLATACLTTLSTDNSLLCEKFDLRLALLNLDNTANYQYLFSCSI